MFSRCSTSSVPTSVLPPLYRPIDVDLEELKQDTMMPEQVSSPSPPEGALPPAWEEPDTGTVVTLAEVDKHDYRSAGGLAEGLAKLIP